MKNFCANMHLLQKNRKIFYGAAINFFAPTCTRKPNIDELFRQICTSLESFIDKAQQ